MEEFCQNSCNTWYYGLSPASRASPRLGMVSCPGFGSPNCSAEATVARCGGCSLHPTEEFHISSLRDCSWRAVKQPEMAPLEHHTVLSFSMATGAGIASHSRGMCHYLCASWQLMLSTCSKAAATVGNRTHLKIKITCKVLRSLLQSICSSRVGLEWMKMLPAAVGSGRVAALCVPIVSEGRGFQRVPS